MRKLWVLVILMAMVCLPVICFGGYKINNFSPDGVIIRGSQKFNIGDVDPSKFELQEGDILEIGDGGFIDYKKPMPGEFTEILRIKKGKWIIVPGGLGIMDYGKFLEDKAKADKTGKPAVAKVLKPAPLAVEKETMVPLTKKLTPTPLPIEADKTVRALVEKKPALPTIKMPEIVVKSAAESSKIIVETTKGDSLWKILEREAEARGMFKDLIGSKKEIVAKKTYIVDTLKVRVLKNKKEFGLSNIDSLRIGQKLNLTKIFPSEETKKVVVAAEGLDSARIQNILANNKVISDWITNHPGEPLDTNKVKEILNPLREKVANQEKLARVTWIRRGGKITVKV